MRTKPKTTAILNIGAYQFSLPVTKATSVVAALADATTVKRCFSRGYKESWWQLDPESPPCIEFTIVPERSIREQLALPAPPDA